MLTAEMCDAAEVDGPPALVPGDVVYVSGAESSDIRTWTGPSHALPPPGADCEQVNHIGSDCTAKASCAYAKSLTGPGDVKTSWYALVRLTGFMLYPDYLAFRATGVNGVHALAGPNASESEVTGLLKAEQEAPIKGLVTATGRGPTYTGAVISVQAGACRFERMGNIETYYTAWAVNKYNPAHLTHTGCTLDGADATLTLGGGETRTVDIPSGVRCDSDGTLGVHVYGMGANGEIKFDGAGLTGTVTLDGKDATHSPVQIQARAGVRTPLPISVKVTASPTASAGKWSGSVIILATPA